MAVSAMARGGYKRAVAEQTDNAERLPPEGTQLREAARLVAEVFGCPIEEAANVLSLGIAARITEQVAERDTQPEE
jgi:hypothetical protein